MGRAPFKMKGFSYPGKSPLRDAKQTEMMTYGSAAGSEHPGLETQNQLQGGVIANLGVGGSVGTTGGTGATHVPQTGQNIPTGFQPPWLGGVGLSTSGTIVQNSWIENFLSSQKNRKRKHMTTRGKRGYEVAGSWSDTPSASDRYVTSDKTLMTS